MEVRPIPSWEGGALKMSHLQHLLGFRMQGFLRVNVSETGMCVHLKTEV